ncbi:ANR family transcriptional regulator (plasmid) [Edwardsiella tarda]|uniref:ANR family transcriptional regulator n=1 Tax=Edwardsiella tarda TaxID=636 RepID=UPI001D046A76|nr:ANR family transcriptional regulator [Edwardsiella tarda]UCQ29539.1 ANR family transcriptional regulator [Edwardsiella tarda]
MIDIGENAILQHRQRARSAVILEREAHYDEAAEAWSLVARLAPQPDWQSWAIQRAKVCRLQCSIKRDERGYRRYGRGR